MSKVLLVTGGSRGIGAAICRLAAKSGYTIAINYQRGISDAWSTIATFIPRLIFFFVVLVVSRLMSGLSDASPRLGPPGCPPRSPGPPAR